MSSFPYIIFDFDDTLSDFQRAKEHSKQLITPYLLQSGIDVKKYWAHYEKIFEPLFSRYIHHELTVDEYRLMRFEHSGVTHMEAAKYNEIYLSAVNQAILFDDVVPVLTELKSRGYRLYVLTNGPAVQRTKIGGCEIAPLLEDIFISSELGVGKPDTLVYDTVFQRIGANSKSQLLMVGDSYENDCVAAEQAGITAIQVNRRNKAITHYKTQIASLYPLLELLPKRDE